MFFLGRRGPPAGGPHPYGMKLQPPRAEPLDGGRTGMHLRGRRRAREKEPNADFLLAISACIVAGALAYDVAMSSWSLVVAFGLSAFAVHVRFAYAVEKRLRPRRLVLRSPFLEVILPGFPAAIISLIVMAVWFGVVLRGSFPSSPRLFFLALLGACVALFIGKIIQWNLETFRRTRGSSDAGPGRATDRSSKDSIPSRE